MNKIVDVTVKQVAEIVGAPVEPFLKQLAKAGIEISNADQTITGKEKMRLLDHLWQSHGKHAGDDKKITLRRRSTSELKIAGAGDAVPKRLVWKCANIVPT